MAKDIIFGLVGGLGLFLYGMTLMGEGLQKAAGDRMRRILETLTGKTWMGVLVGTFVTSVIQSSSATTVMVVSFVNAGLMTLAQAVGVIMGANIGTTVTAQLIAFKLGAIALPIIGIGFLMTFLSRRKIIKYFGQVILGFGILFLGMEIMTDAVKPLREFEGFNRWMVMLADKPVLGFLLGLVMTMVIQSSSASIGILIATASQGLISFEAALPVLFGCNVGTCITTVLASIGTTLTAKRTALTHVLFNLIGSILFLFILPLYRSGVEWFTAAVMHTGGIERLVANAHTGFNIINTFLWLPFASVLVKIVKFILPGEDTSLVRGPKYLDKRMLGTPSIALQLAVKEIGRMSKLVVEMYDEAKLSFFTNDPMLKKKIDEKERVVDELQREITLYLSTLLSRSVLTEAQSAKLAGLMHVISDIERIGDYAENISEHSLEKIEKKSPFSDAAMFELERIFGLVRDIVIKAVTALQQNDKELAHEVWRMEPEIDRMEEELRINHIGRLNEGQCIPGSAIIYIELLDELERIADHATNLADAVIGRNLKMDEMLKEEGKEGAEGEGENYSH